MSVQNGQRADEDTFNDAFLSKPNGGTVVEKVIVNKPADGAAVDVQVDINQAKSDIIVNAADIDNLELIKEDKAQKGIANGYAELDGTGKVPLDQIPDKFASIEGNWDASTNTPTLADGVGNLGEIYIVNVAGTQDLGSGSQTFDVGDWVVYNSSDIWQKTINSTAVTSVNGQTGAVSLAFDDLTDVGVGTPGPADDQKAVIYDDASGEYILGTPVGSGGSGGINYIENSDFEIDATGWNLYRDGAVSEPVDGTGGTSTINQGIDTLNPLRGDQSLSLSTTGSDSLGSGISTDFTIDRADLEKTLKVSFNYDFTQPTNYVTNDLRVFIYDIDNATLLGAVRNDDDGAVLVTGESGTLLGEFDATDSLNYRLIIHGAQSSTLAWTMRVDNVQVGPLEFFPIVNQTPWEVFTGDETSPDNPFANFSIATFNWTLWRRQIGNALHLKMFCVFTAGGNTSSPIEFQIPDGLTTSLPIGSGSIGVPGGANWYDNSNAAGLHRTMAPYFGSSSQMFFAVADQGAPTVILRYNNLGASDRINFDVVLPIDQYSNGNVVSNTELTQSTVYAEGDHNTGQSIPSGAFTTVIFNNEFEDDFGIYDNTTGVFTAKKRGLFLFNFAIAYQANSTGARGTAVLVNGVDRKVCNSVPATLAPSIHTSSGTRLLRLNAGDTVEMEAIQISGGPLNLSTLSNNSYFSINSLPDFTNYGVLNPNSELVETTSTPVNYTITQNTFGDLTSIDLTAGTWDISAIVYFFSSGATSAGIAQVGVSTTPGNSAAGLILGDTSGAVNIPATAQTYIPAPIPNHTVVVNSPTTYYLKSNKLNGIANQQVFYKLSARRVK